MIELVIRFSHDYVKLPVAWEGTQAMLLSVSYDQVERLKKVAPSFIFYDTKIRGEDGFYPLDFKDAIVLVFIHYNTGLVFTTIRRHTTRKYDYYKDNQGSSFKLVKS